MVTYNPENIEIGARIQEIRLKKEMTQEDLAEKAGIGSAQQISNIERGLAGFSVSRLKKICKTLDIEADYLLFGITPSNTETILHQYLEKMTPSQMENLLEIVKAYAKSCGIEESYPLEKSIY